MFMLRRREVEAFVGLGFIAAVTLVPVLNVRALFRRAAAMWGKSDVVGGCMKDIFGGKVIVFCAADSSGTAGSNGSNGSAGRVVLRSVINGCCLSSCSVALSSGAGGGSRSAFGAAGGGAFRSSSFKIISKDVRSFFTREALARRFFGGEFGGFTVAPGDFLVCYPPYVDLILSSVAPILSLAEFAELSKRFCDFGGVVSSVKINISGMCTDNIVIVKE